MTVDRCNSQAFYLPEERNKVAKTCRCPICGQKNAGSNNVRNSYLRVNLGKDEHGFVYGAKSKKHSRKLRRVRENRNWIKEQS